MPMNPTASVKLQPLTEAERKELLGPCSLCGTRRKDEPRAWRLIVDLPAWDEPAEYIACSRCRRALRELAEILFRDRIAGVVQLEADAPYRLSRLIKRGTSPSGATLLHLIREDTGLRFAAFRAINCG